jgi:hypothetical protein
MGKELKGLPVYEMTIDESLSDNSEVSAVALVDQPAIQRNFIAFNATENGMRLSLPFTFSQTNEEERKVFGPLMLADMLIYRKPPQVPEECYVKFTASTIDKIAQKFFQKSNQQEVNLMHDPNQAVEGVTMFQSWIVNRAMGILPMNGYEDAADGSWFGGFKVNNDEVWEKIKAGEVKGFSVEGVFNLVPQKFNDISTEEFLQQLNIISASLD